MRRLSYIIDGKPYTVAVSSESEFQTGENVPLSTAQTDIAFGQAWYNQGYAELPFLNDDEFDSLKSGISGSIERIVEEVKGHSLNGFRLEDYHRFVQNEDDHQRIVSKTRDLFSEDFIFPVEQIIHRLKKVVGFELTDFNPVTQDKVHIIVRINRPGSHDFNPPHKDIYEGVDDFGFIPPYMNFWIPIAGATELTNLPLVPGSHLLHESAILRTKKGADVEGKKYRVRAIESWNGSNELQRSKVKYKDILVFSSHLVHGLAVNDEKDLTRVALEFRLFRK